jgi:hypothetical protein
MLRLISVALIKNLGWKRYSCITSKDCITETTCFAIITVLHANLANPQRYENDRNAAPPERLTTALHTDG